MPSVSKEVDLSRIARREEWGKDPDLRRRLLEVMSPTAEPSTRYAMTSGCVRAIQAGAHWLVPTLMEAQRPMLRRVYRELRSSAAEPEDLRAVVDASFIEAVSMVNPDLKVGPWLRWKTRRLALTWIDAEKDFDTSVRKKAEQLSVVADGNIHAVLGPDPAPRWRSAELDDIAARAGVSDDDLALVIRHHVDGVGWRSISRARLGDAAPRSAVATETERLRKRSLRAINRMKDAARGRPGGRRHRGRGKCRPSP